MNIKFDNSFKNKLLESFFGQMMISILSMLITFSMAKLFSIEIFGEYIYILTWVMIFSMFIQLGMDNSLIYFNINKGKRYNKVSFIIIFLLTIILFFVSFILFKSTLLTFSLPLVFLVAAQELFFGLLKAEGRIKIFFKIKIFSNLLIQFILVIIVANFSSPDSKSLIIILYISNAIAFLIYYAVTYKNFTIFYIDKKFIAYSIPTMMIAFVAIFMNRIDLIMIGYYLTKDKVGLYQVLSQISTIIVILLSIFNTVFAPKIAILYKENKITEISDIYIKYTRLLFLVSLLLFTIIVIMRIDILNYFGKDYLKGEYTLILLSLSQLIVVFFGSVGYMLTMIGKVNIQLTRVVMASAINIVLNFILINDYGILGVAISTLVALSISSLSGYLFVSNIFNIKLYKYI
jgi:O-antigen/teichoic acid export membrane protein